MAGSKFIPHADLAAWLAELSAAMRVVAPRAEGNTVVYREYDPAMGTDLSRKPTESAKHILFPRSEELFRFSYQRPAFAPEDEQAEEVPAPSLTIEQPADPAPTVVFGLLGCDAGGMATFDPVFTGSPYKDVYYLKKREATILIVRACNDVLSTCFCNWVGGDPANREAGDILATELPEGWLLEPVTERAEKVLGSTLLQDAPKGAEKKASDAHKAARKAMGKAPDLKDVEQALYACFDDAEFWAAQSAGCLACGACTYLCPTCHCFSITDETAGRSGVRLRSWDTCMASLYTLEASGHNPRNQKAARWRNRLGHKFAYFQRNNDGRISCCGCGRCIKSCPSSVDIRAIVTNALDRAKEKADG